MGSSGLFGHDPRIFAPEPAAKPKGVVWVVRHTAESGQPCGACGGTGIAGRAIVQYTFHDRYSAVEKYKELERTHPGAVDKPVEVAAEVYYAD